MKLPLLAAFLLALSPLLAHAAGGGNPGSRLATSRAGQLHEGYALLYDLADEEKDANMIFVMKTGQPWTKETTKDISDLYGKIHKDIETWSKADNFDLEATHLPAIEDQTRAAIDKAHTHDLFALKGPPFDHLFLQLQEESLYYGLYLLDALQQYEKDPTRLKALAGYEKEMRRLQLRVAEKI